MAFLSDEESKTLRHLSDKVGDAVKAVLGPAATELGGWAGDVVAARRNLWRLQNLLTTVEKARKLLADQGIDPSTAGIPPRQSAPLLDAIANEDDETVQRLWAGLIANAADPHRRQQVAKAFIHILSSIDPLEASILEWLKPLLLNTDPSKTGEAIASEEVCSRLQVSEAELKFSLHHLASLGCFRVDSSTGYLAVTGPEDPWPYLVVHEVEFRPTALAAALIQACATDIEEAKEAAVQE